MAAMLKMLTAFTDEVDDSELAVQDILTQLDIPNALLRHSAGLLFCYADFVETGVVKALCDALPFAVVGCTTLTNGVPGGAGIAALSLAVLTSDDVRFSAVMSQPLTSANLDANMREAFDRARGRRPETPALALAFAPMQLDVGSEAIAEAMFAAAGDTPVFGSVACDHTLELNTSYTFFNGKADAAAACMLLLYGDVQPRFFLKVISDEKIQKQKAIITGSEGSVLRKINGMPLMRYLEMLGVSKDNGIENIGVVPFIVKYTDGTPPVARAIYTITPEGHAICGGKMPVGSTLAVGRLDTDDILKTAGSTVAQALTGDRPSALLMLPCMARNMALGADFLAEMDVVRKTIGDTTPYLLAYAGGEICPDVRDDGNHINRFHNFTFIACSLC